MAESIDYYMDQTERETIRRALLIARAQVQAAYQIEEIIYDKDRMSALESFEIDLDNVLGQLE